MAFWVPFYEGKADEMKKGGAASGKYGKSKLVSPEQLATSKITLAKNNILNL